MNLALIPARGGSKRIHRKNNRLFRGRPMNREGRRRAGFSEEFLDALEAFEAQR